MTLWRSFARTRLTPHFHIPRSLLCRPTRYCSTTPTPKANHYGLVTSLKIRLANDKPRSALNFFQEYMRDNQLDSEERFAAYVKSITIFMEHGNLTDAYTVWGRMQAEGYITPRQIQATMAFMRTLALEQPTISVMKAAERAFSLDSFGEEEFRTMLRIISRVTRLSPNEYDTLIKLFINSRGSENYVLSRRTTALLLLMHSKLDPPKKAKMYPSLLGEASVVGQQDESRAAEFAPVREMAHADPELAPAIHSAMQSVEFTGSSYDRIFYNVIMTAMVDKRRYEEAFALYKMMKESNISTLPDAFTFATLFRALTLFSGPRSIRTRGHKTPENVPSLRELYRDMIYCHKQFVRRKDPSVALNGFLLNRIIHNLMNDHDYAAAFVALRTYAQLRIPVTNSTYCAVFGSLIHRLEVEHPVFKYAQDLQQFWGYRFLGSPEEPLKSIDMRVVEAILHSGGQPALQLSPLRLWTEEELFQHKEQISKYAKSENTANRQNVMFRLLGDEREGKRGYRVPTGVVLLGLLDAPRERFSVIPLQRIVRRAFLAEHQHTLVTPSRVVSLAISHAKSEMLPPIEEPPKPREPTQAS